jgi:hypothetical protein
MKRIILVAGLILTVSLGTYARRLVAEGKTYSALGNYKIEVDNKSFVINGKEQIKVAIEIEKGIKKYYVLSDNLSVQYVANRHYFGVEKLSPEFEKDGYRTSDAALNRAEYFHQKAITTQRSWKRDNTKLIAAYFPMLLNNVENLVASK